MLLPEDTHFHSPVTHEESSFTSASNGGRTILLLPTRTPAGVQTVQPAGPPQGSALPKISRADAVLQAANCEEKAMKFCQLEHHMETSSSLSQDLNWKSSAAVSTSRAMCCRHSPAPGPRAALVRGHISNSNNQYEGALSLQLQAAPFGDRPLLFKSSECQERIADLAALANLYLYSIIFGKPVKHRKETECSCYKIVWLLGCQRDIMTLFRTGIKA